MVQASSPTEKHVFLQYTQAELDRNYDQRGWVSNPNEIIARYISASKDVRSTFTYSTEPYGDHPDEQMDIFPAPRPSGAGLIFLHGGAWRNFTKDDFSFVAKEFLTAGISTIIVNFSKLPAVRLPDVVLQVRRAIARIHERASGFEIDPRRLYLCGHSSGAHLAMSALLTDWSDFGAPMEVIKAGACISGCYDLHPVLLSARADYIRLTAEEADALSPRKHAERLPCPLLLAYAEHDTNEFRRHSEEFAQALRRVGRSSALLRVPAINHFEIIELLSRRETVLFRSVLSHLLKNTASRDRRTL
jgi:arylformamidase